MSALDIVVVAAAVTTAFWGFVLSATITYLDKADRDLLAEADEAVRLGNAGAEG